MNAVLGKLVGLVLVAGLIVLAMSCGQSKDVVQPQDRAVLTLYPELLPQLEDIYVYELWAIKDDGKTPKYTSLGKFFWDAYLYQMLDLDSNLIDRTFELPEPFMAYDSIAVSVENRNDPDPDNPTGTYILTRDVVPVDQRPLTLLFPYDMAGGVEQQGVTGSYFVGTPTDDDPHSEEEQGIWLATKSASQRRLEDTLSIRRTAAGTLWVNFIQTPDDPDNPLLVDTVGVDTFYVDTTFTVIGLDTLDHIRIDVDWVIESDPVNNYIREINYELQDRGVHYYFIYQNALSNLPELDGWRYNAWVLYNRDSLTLLPKMLPYANNRFTSDTSYGVITLGAFNRSDSADLSNPYIGQLEVPNFPGEDFLYNLPLELTTPQDVDFAQNTALPGFASIVVGIEPDPANFVEYHTRNFPLYFMSDSLRTLAERDAENTPPQADSLHNYLLHNWSQYLPRMPIDVEFTQ